MVFAWGARRWAVALGLAGVGIAGAPSRARAAELRARGPASCPDLSELTFRVERAIGMPLAQAAPLRFDVQFVAGTAAFSARLSVEAGAARASETERVLRAQGCSELADAVAVAIALALGSSSERDGSGLENDPGSAEARDAAIRRTGASGPEAPPGAATSPQAARPSAEDAVRSKPESADDMVGLTPALSVAVVGDAGSLPGVGFGLGLGAELRAGRLGLRAGGTLLFDRHVTLPDSGTQAPGADMSLVLGSLSACTLPFGAAVPVAFLCGGWELGRIEALGTGIEQPRRGSALWSAPRVDLGLGWDIDDSPLRVVGQLTMATPLERDDFYLRDLGTVHRAPAVIGRLAIGVDVRF